MQVPASTGSLTEQIPESVGIVMEHCDKCVLLLGHDISSITGSEELAISILV